MGTETYGIYVPPLTPEATVKTLATAIQTASRDKTLASGLDQIGVEAAYVDSADYALLIANERERWKPIVAASGFKAD